jgi:hypothetical protein
MFVENIFQVAFKEGERKWTWNSFRDFYIYINSTRIVSPYGQGIDQYLTWFHGYCDRLSSKEEMGVDVEYKIQIRKI